MEIVQTIESAALSAVEAVEHPFHTIGDRLKAIAGHLTVFGGHPYAAPPLQEALTALHGVVADLAQEVAELRVPCPCKPAPTASTTAGAGDAGQASSSTATSDAGAAGAIAKASEPAPGAGGFEVVSAADAADFRAWQAAKAAAASFTGQA